MARWKYDRSKPVIGIVGGIGSGKSTVSRLFEREGCGVIDSDVLAHEVLELPAIKGELRKWLGDGVMNGDETVNRRAVGQIVFNDAEKLKRLNGMIHPEVGRQRDEKMKRYMGESGVKAVVWDTPLLVEAGLEKECDAVVYVEVPVQMRAERVYRKRGWSGEELAKREKLQIPLDKKAALADYYVDNSGDEATSLRQVQRVLSQLLAESD